MIHTAKFYTDDLTLYPKNSFQSIVHKDNTGEIETLTRKHCTIGKVRFNIVKNKKKGHEHEDLLFIEAELPSLISDNPLATVSENDFEQICEIIYHATRKAGISLSRESIPSLRVSRVDFFHDINVDNPCGEYISELGKCSYSRHDRNVYNDETVTFHNDNSTLCIYNKVAHIRDTSPEKNIDYPGNILRFEHRLINTKTIIRKLDILPTFSNVFSLEMSKKSLSSAVRNVVRPFKTIESYTKHDNDIVRLMNTKRIRRNRVITFLAYRNIEVLFNEFNYDTNAIVNFLESLEVSERRQISREVKDALDIHSQLNPKRVLLFDEVLTKLSA